MMKKPHDDARKSISLSHALLLHFGPYLASQWAHSRHSSMLRLVAEVPITFRTLWNMQHDYFFTMVKGSRMRVRVSSSKELTHSLMTLGCCWQSRAEAQKQQQQ
jgi:hypothetical protein